MKSKDPLGLNTEQLILLTASIRALSAAEQHWLMQRRKNSGQ